METFQGYHHIETRKDYSIPKNYRLISLLCHTYKLYKRMILHRIAPAIEQHLIKEEACFRSGKSCTIQLLNLTQHIEDGYKEGMITRTAFVYLSAAYDTVNHRLLIQHSTTRRWTANYVEFSRTCFQFKKKPDGECKRMVYHRGVFSPPHYSTYTRTISQS